MNIEEAIENLKIYMKVTNKQIENGELFLDSFVNTEKIQIKSIETLLSAYEKEKEKNKKLHYIRNEYANYSENTFLIDKDMMTSIEKNKYLVELNNGNFIDVNELAMNYEKEKEENKRLRKCHLQYEEMTGIDLLLPEKEE